MPAVVYGKAFVVGRDKRLTDTVATLEANHGPMVNLYVTSIHDVILWCIRNLTGTPLANAFTTINGNYGSDYDPNNPYLGPLV